MNNWYVVETLPRCELRSQQHLERQHFTCFFPRFHKTRRHARRVEQVVAPVFPGYLFVRFDPGHDRWRSINGTLGVKRLLGSAERPQPMAGAVMRALLARCEGDLMTRQLPSLRVGQRVRLIAGPLADQLATIEHLDDRGRVGVLLQCLGSLGHAEVSAAHIGPE